MSRTAKIGVTALLVFALCAVAFGCGRASVNTPTEDPFLTTTEPATWPDGSLILPEDDITDEFPTDETEDETTLDDSLTTEETEPANAAPEDFPSPEILRGPPDTAAQTFTGLRALAERPIAIDDPNNRAGLPTKKIEHAYGVAKDGVPNQISIDFQKFFEAKHYAAVAYDSNVGQEKPLYLTFDCGYENGNTARILDTLREKNVKAAFFCTVDEMKSAPEIVARMIAEGHIVGNHSVKHPSFAEVDRPRMAQEVLEADNYLRANFGYSAPFFRFPKGEYTESALEAVGSLGFTSVFWSAAYADWDVNAQKGAKYALDTVTARIHPGAILLLHSISKDNADAMGQIIDAAKAQGYVFRELTELSMFRE